MTENVDRGMTIDTIDRQKKYVEGQKQRGDGQGIVFAAAFLRGMRDLGYKSPAWALAEMLDNAFQAGAETTSIRFGFNKGNEGRVKPDSIAVIDDGNGMIPEMISYAVRWGGTNREDDRHGFGRFGYGLPSSAVSLAKRYTVYSKTPNQNWHAVTVDIEQLALASSDMKKTQKLLAPRPAELPNWILETKEMVEKKVVLDVSKLQSGTIVVLEDPDRLSRLSGWKLTKVLKEKLLHIFGVIYRYWVPERRIIVDGVALQPVDPLFLMEHALYYDETPVHAEKVETRTFELETPEGKKGIVSIRASLLPPNFHHSDPATIAQGGRKMNKRWDIIKPVAGWNGILVCRNWRHIDTVQVPWTKFQNLDAHVKIEINFDPDLDEIFGVTTSKQQITINDEPVWEKLKNAGSNAGNLFALIRELRTRFKELQNELEVEAENQATLDQSRKSAIAMEETEKFKGPIVAPSSVQEEDAMRQLQREASKRSDASGKSQEDVLKDLLEETKKRRWEIELANVPEGPFYRPKRLGEQKRVMINSDHPFYSKLYAAPYATPEVKGALEVLLFVLAERELDSTGDAENFYKSERTKWSERLRYALNSLVSDETMVNLASSIAENMHVAASTE